MVTKRTPGIKGRGVVGFAPASYPGTVPSPHEVPVLVAADSPSFFGLEPARCAYAGARAAVYTAPFEGAVSYGLGASKGPAAILEASCQVELFDHELGLTPADAGIASVDLDRVHRPLETFEDVVAHIDATLPRLLADGKFPVLLGGDHSVVPPTIRHYLARYPELGIFHVDAHADLRDSYDDNRDSHACAMRRILDHPVRQVASIGIRNLSEEEWLYLKGEDRLRVVWGGGQMKSPAEWRAEVVQAIEALPRHVLITFDVDGLDPSVVPGTGTPEPGGLSWQQALWALDQLFQRREVVGADLNELAPLEGQHVSEFAIAKLLYRLIGLRVRSDQRPPRS